METIRPYLLLADDDSDDCLFFKEALEELDASALLATVNNGEELMKHLIETISNLPDILFLDLNMPLKSGSECLLEIKQHEVLKDLPVIIMSTSFNPDIVYRLHQQGAHYYARKPAEFLRLKELIRRSLEMVRDGLNEQPAKEEFVINAT